MLRHIRCLQRECICLRGILVGGAIAGTLDMIPALISFGLTAPQGVAAGLPGRSAALPYCILMVQC
jgi:hypothetical protein